MGGAGIADGASDPIVTRLVKDDKVPWYSKPNLRYLYFMLFPTCMGIELTSGWDSQMINAVQIFEQWQIFFGRPQGGLQGIIAAAYNLGAICSLPFIGIVNDKFGRRVSIFGGSCIMVVGALIQGFSVHGELSYPKERPVMTSLFNVSYFFGQILAAAICFGTNSIANDYGWKIPSWLQMCPSLFQIFLIFFVPESPRWLITKDRSDEAFDILVMYHAEGDRESEFVKAEFAQMKTTIELEMQLSNISWMDLFKTAGMRRRALISCMLGLFTQWSGNTLISYYLSDILDMIGRTEARFKQSINVATACWNLVCGAIASMAVLRFKRRHMFLACTCSLLTVYIFWTICMQQAMKGKDMGVPNTAANGGVLFFIFAYAPAYNLGYNALTYTYMVEIWPFAERSHGIAFFQLFGRLAGFFTTFVNPIGLENAGWKYLISYCCFLTFEIAFVWFMFPETCGRTLEELAFLFEDKALTDQAVSAVEKVVGHRHEENASRKSTDVEVKRLDI
ncbi:hypothetical protein DL771_002818 [Monosporascus sp. 5C6A]|nr:hypothetical protein DL771_002818 [Monosporascus sp. 5C6A]